MKYMIHVGMVEGQMRYNVAYQSMMVTFLIARTLPPHVGTASVNSSHLGPNCS